MLRRINAWALPKLDSVVVLDGAMADLRRAGRRPGRPRARDPELGARRAVQARDDRRLGRLRGAGLSDRFVVLYLGNIGLGHRFDTVIAAAARLSNDVVFLFVGGGPRWEELATQTAHLENVMMHPYVDKEVTPSVLAGADTSLICLEDGALGVMSPSKLHGSLGMGLPITYVGPHGSNISEAIDRYGCGVSVRHGDVDGLVESIRRWQREPSTRGHAAAQARRAFEDSYSDRATLPMWDSLLDA